MGKIKINNMGLPGIRLTDIYNSDDYKKWMQDSTNVKLVESTIRDNKYDDPNLIRGHLYMNSKIKDAIGEEGFNKLPKGLGLQDKINWYNNNIPEESQPAQTDTTNTQFEEVQPEEVQQPLESTIPDGGNIVPKSDDGHAMFNWFKEKSDGATDKMYNDYIQSVRNQRVAEEPANPFAKFIKPAENTKAGQLYNELETLKKEHPERTVEIKLLENELNSTLEDDKINSKKAADKAEQDLNDFKFVFNNFENPDYLPKSKQLWNSAKTTDSVNNLSSDIRTKLDNDSQFAFSAFEQFDRLAYEMIPQYRNYHDTDAMPITPNEMKDLMAQYYAIRTIKDLDEANNFIQNNLQHIIAKNQSILEKAETALKLGGNYFTGNTLATLGIVLNTPWALAQSVQKDADIEDLSNFKEFLYYTTQNPLTQWANDLQSTGTWSREAQEKYKELGYNALQLQREPGNETKFLDWRNTPFDLAAQGAYTIAGMWTGTTAAQLLNATVGRGASRLASRMLSRGAANAATRWTSMAINTLGNAVAVGATAYLPAAAEASMDAMEKYNTVKDSAQQDVLDGLEKELQKDLEDGTFDEWYNQNSRLPIETSSTEGQTPDELEREMLLRNQEKAYLWEQYRNLKVQDVLNDPKTQQEIENLAFRTGAKTMFDEATWIAFGDMFFSNILGRGFKELKKGVVRGVTGKPVSSYKWVPEGNHYRAVAKPTTVLQKVGAIGRGVGEAVEEGFEELFQTVDSQMREDIAHNYIAEYVENRYDPEAVAQLSDNFRENWDVASKSIKQNVLSEEALYSFLLGAVSAGLGSPTVLQGIKTATTKAKAGEKASVWDFWRNPIIENLQEVKTKQLQNEAEAAEINRWLQQHPEVDTYNDETAILKFIAQKENAASRDDEVLYRDALMGQKVATMLMMDRVRPNGMKLNMYARLKALSNLDANSPEARAVVDQVLEGDDSIIRTTEGPLNEEELNVFNQTVKRAKEDFDTYRTVKAQMKILDSQFGGSVSTEAKEALAYGMVMHTDWMNRINEITKASIDSYNKANPNNPIVPISPEEYDIKNAIAKYGSAEAVENEYKQLMQERNALRANKRRMYKYEYKTALNKNTQQIKENQEAKRAFEKSDKENLPIVSAQEILSLSNKARAYMLDESNRKNYSKAQLDEIDKFTQSDGIGGETLKDLRDAGRLQNKADYFKEQYSDLTKNNGALIPLFNRDIKAKASEKWSRSKLEDTLNATSYEQFKEELDKALSTGEFTVNDRMQFSKIFSDPRNPNPNSYEFYQKYKKEEENRAKIRRIIENSPAYKELSDTQKQIATEVISQQQRSSEPLTSENIVRTLNDSKFREQLSEEELEQLAIAANKIIEQWEAYKKNVAAEKERQDKLAKAKMAEEAARMVPGGMQKDTIMNGSKYQADKDFFDTIFKKISSIFKKRNSQALSKEEFINFINLYTDEELSTDIMGGEFKTDLTLDNLSDIVKELTTAIDNAAYLNSEITKDTTYQNTVALINALKGIVNTIQRSRSTSSPISLNQFIKNSIIQINPTMIGEFKTDIKTKLQKNISFDTKNISKLGSNTEKEWYETNKIEQNLATVAAIGARTLNYAFIKDNSLIDKVANELGVDNFTDDNVPIIVAAKVTKDTKGAIQLEDGNWYLYIGLLRDSRDTAAHDRTNLNVLRSLALEQEESGMVKQDGKPYISKGGAIKYVNKSEDNTVQTDSLKDWLLDKYKGDKEAAKKDFLEHFRRAKANINTETKTASISYEWKGKTIHRTFQTENSHSEWTYPIYLLEKPDGTVEPKILFIRSLDEFTFNNDLDISNVYEALSGPILSDELFSKMQEFDFLRRPIKHIYKQISMSVEGFNSKRPSTRQETARQLNRTLGRFLEKRFNFKRPAREGAAFKVELSVKDNNLEFVAYQELDDIKTQYESIPRTLASIPIEDLSSKDAVYRFIQNSLKNLMYDEDGNLRRDENGNPLVKLEVNYRENDQSVEKVFDEARVEDLLLANAWQLQDTEMNPVPDGISINATNQDSTPIKKSGNPRQDAIAAITRPEFIDEHDGEHFEVGPDETEVTTFIHGTDEEYNTDTLSGQLARNLGTSIDKLYRVWRKLRTPDKIIEYMKQNNLGSWVGLRTTNISEMCQEFERIDKFFTSRDEVPISENLIFKGSINVDGKTHYFIGKPDIITVDKDGKYHIYDMKSFRYQSGMIKNVPGFTNNTFVINGIRDFESKYSSWQQQMSIYRMLIESKLGKDTVSTEFGVIPVRLGYNVNGKITDYKMEGIGAYKITDPDGKPFYLSFDPAPLEKFGRNSEKLTRCYDDAIRIPAIMDVTTINPTGWKQMSEADKLKSSLQDVRQQNPEVKDVPEPQIEVVSSTSDRKDLKDMNEDEIGKSLAGDEITINIEDLINGACN